MDLRLRVESQAALVLLLRRGKAVMGCSARSEEEEQALWELAQDLEPELAQLRTAIQRLNH